MSVVYCDVYIFGYIYFGYVYIHKLYIYSSRFYIGMFIIICWLWKDRIIKLECKSVHKLLIWSMWQQGWSSWLWRGLKKVIMTRLSHSWGRGFNSHSLYIHHKVDDQKIPGSNPGQVYMDLLAQRQGVWLRICIICLTTDMHFMSIL